MASRTVLRTRRVILVSSVVRQRRRRQGVDYRRRDFFDREASCEIRCALVYMTCEPVDDNTSQTLTDCVPVSFDTRQFSWVLHWAAAHRSREDVILSIELCELYESESP